MIDSPHEPDDEVIEEPDAESSGDAATSDEQTTPAGSDTMAPGEADFGSDDDDNFEEFEGGPGLAGTVSLSGDDLKGALEALILVSDKPIAPIRLARLARQDVGAVRKALAELQHEFRGRGIVLDEIAGGYQFRTSPRFAPFVRGLTQQKPTRLTRAQLEVLAIVAYRQPVTRPEIDDVRGVDSGSAIKVLLERDVIKIIGKKEEAGRPMLYGTTNAFLELFGLNNLRDLPTLKEFAELTAESRDIFERRIGEPFPGQGQGMDLSTHYEAPPEGDESDHDEGEAQQEAGEAHAQAGDEGAVIEAAEDDGAGLRDDEVLEGEWTEADSDAADTERSDEELASDIGDFDASLEDESDVDESERA